MKQQQKESRCIEHDTLRPVPPADKRKLLNANTSKPPIDKGRLDEWHGVNVDFDV